MVRAADVAGVAAIARPRSVVAGGDLGLFRDDRACPRRGRPDRGKRSMNATDTRQLCLEELPAAARHLRESGARMRMAYALVTDDNSLELRYLAVPAGPTPFILWRCKVTGDPPSLAEIWPLLGWYEREIMDLFGIRFHGHPEPNHLVLHDHIPPPFAPAGPEHKRPEPLPAPNRARSLPELAAPDVQTLPFGPVRADVLESAEFTFLYIGEQILHYQPHL